MVLFCYTYFDFLCITLLPVRVRLYHTHAREDIEDPGTGGKDISEPPCGYGKQTQFLSKGSKCSERLSPLSSQLLCVLKYVLHGWTAAAFWLREENHKVWLYRCSLRMKITAHPTVSCLSVLLTKFHRMDFAQLRYLNSGSDRAHLFLAPL